MQLLKRSVTTFAVALALTTTAFADEGRVRPVAPGGGASGGGGRVAGGGRSPQDLLKERRQKNADDRRRGVGAGSASPAAPTTQSSLEPAPTAAARAPGLVGLHHGEVKLVGDLARVDLTLTITNRGTGVLEWAQVYAVDPQAEVIGASLHRVGQRPIVARTLTAPDAHRIYEEARGPRVTTPTPGKDPLRLERVARDRLAIVVFPVAPNEAVDVKLTFVTPLRGRGAVRIYEDVMGGEGEQLAMPGTPQVRNAPPPTTPVETPDAATWSVQAGTLVLDAEPEGMVLDVEHPDGQLRFSGVARTGAKSPRPSITFLVPHPEAKAISLNGGSFGARTATWRFDAREFIEARSIESFAGMELRILPVRSSTSRVAPWRFGASTDPLPVTARVSNQARELRYVVQVVDAEGAEVARFDERLPIERRQSTRADEGTVTGWHRAMLARRVLDWATGNAKRQEQALRYAVDVGVLVEGTAALAIPRAELRRVSPASRRTFQTDGAPLGAQRREADLKYPPSGSMHVR